MKKNFPINEDPRAVRSRQALHSAMLRLLKAKPFDQITIRDIVAKAGIGYATFFRHHPTKEALLDAIAAEQISTVFRLSMPVFDLQNMHPGSVALFTHVDDHRTLWSTLLTGGAAGTIRDEFVRQAREVAASRGDPSAWLPADAGAVLIVSGTIELLAWWLRQSEPMPIERIAEIHVEVVVSPVVAAASKRQSAGASSPSGTRSAGPRSVARNRSRPGSR